MQSTCRVLGDSPHFFRYGIGGFPADVGIDFIENQHWNLILAARTVLSASITRANSPEEAMARNGRGGSPALGANWNSTSIEDV